MKITCVILDDNINYDLSRFLPLLPEDRLAKAARYKFFKDKLRSLTAGLLIYHAVGGGELIYGDRDKPYLAAGGKFFSVSHSGDIVAIATDTAEVGCDVEGIPGDNRLKIADRFFHPNERGYVASATDKNAAFCRIWTRKEAYLKMTGEGIISDLTAFDTTSEPLNSRLYTRDMYGYYLSVCTAEAKIGSDIDISVLELKDFLDTI